MKQVTRNLEDLRLAEEEAKKAWDRAVRAANEAISLAHQKWVLANRALAEAKVRAKITKK
jgi:hypothetical protein